MEVTLAAFDLGNLALDTAKILASLAVVIAVTLWWSWLLKNFGSF